MSRENLLGPVHPFRFHIDFAEHGKTEKLSLCGGAFAECTGLEATMEPKEIAEGGRNYGVVQRSGPVKFATVVLKRGVTTTRHLWAWFDLVTREGAYAYRLDATITMFDTAGEGVMQWVLENAVPVKFKGPDLNANGADVAIEELHIAHEGFTIEVSSAKLADVIGD